MRSGARCGAVIVLCACAAACARAGVFAPEYEYEEVLYLSLDGSATINVNASADALVALHGAELATDPQARIDRQEVREFFGAPSARTAVSLGRRDGRRFVHATVDVEDVHTLSRLTPFQWSDYRLTSREDVVEFRQTIGPPRAHPPAARRWQGDEVVAFRMHLPSEILFHNAPGGRIARGNILEWEQPLADRLAGEPIDIRVRLAPRSILTSTLILFGTTAAAALATLAGVIWWISRRGRDA